MLSILVLVLVTRLFAYVKKKKHQIVKLRLVPLISVVYSYPSILKKKNTPPKKKISVGTSLMAQCLKLRASNAGVMGLISSQATKIPNVMQYGRKKKTGRNSVNTSILHLLNRTDKNNDLGLQ